MDFTLKLSSNALTSPKATPSLLKTEFNWINPIIVVGRKANSFMSTPQEKYISDGQQLETLRFPYFSLLIIRHNGF